MWQPYGDVIRLSCIWITESSDTDLSIFIKLQPVINITYIMLVYEAHDATVRVKVDCIKELKYLLF